MNCIPLVAAFLLLGVAGYVVDVANAQTSTAAAQPRPYQVAVVDIAQLIKNHPTFITKQKELQEYAKGKEAEFETRKLAIANREKTLTDLKLTPGTPDHEKAVEEVTSLVTTLDKDVKIAQRKVMTENSIILYETYKEVREEIANVAKQAKIAQVMDYRTMDANPADPNSVGAMLEQNLIWYDDNLDISQAIVNRIYQKRNIATVPNLNALRAQEKAAAVASPSRETPARTANTNGIPAAANVGGAGTGAAR
ncbi:MAG: OmpH family outer membrane protein [Planctomycetaceae bacterium]|jgi:Skp family chaperone for outer membrane proteins|nr:OmpH family outer membrane protein [Planctomycetaceae bacterium]